MQAGFSGGTSFSAGSVCGGKTDEPEGIKQLSTMRGQCVGMRSAWRPPAEITLRHLGEGPGEDSGDLHGRMFRLQTKKIGVHRLHGNMLPENSFPQICVVSVNIIVESTDIAQEYLWSVTRSNYKLTN
jgi:hypothetical protein